MVRRFVLNADGRSRRSALQGGTFPPGTYRLVFDVAAYFRARGVDLPEPPSWTAWRWTSASPAQEHYHVPLLVSPWSYSTYRGS